MSSHAPAFRPFVFIGSRAIPRDRYVPRRFTAHPWCIGRRRTLRQAIAAEALSRPIDALIEDAESILVHANDTDD